MKELSIIEEFENSWKYVREMTDSFIHCVPENRWTFSHHEKFAPLVKQFIHVIKVYGCFVDAISTRKLDMSKKKLMFEGEENLENVLSHLKKIDEKLKNILSDLKKSGLDDFKIEIFGMHMGFIEYTNNMIQHEAGHYGIWANYAAFGGFETPKMWQADWKL